MVQVKQNLLGDQNPPKRQQLTTSHHRSVSCLEFFFDTSSKKLNPVILGSTGTYGQMYLAGNGTSKLI